MSARSRLCACSVSLAAVVLAWMAACSGLRGAGAAAVPGSGPEDGSDDSVAPLEARLWRAGRAIPPGLSASRVAELEAERSQALAILARSLTRGEEERITAWLADPETPDELWCSAARAAAALERYDLAPLFITALEPSASARRAVAARAALHQIYGRWFQRPSEVQPYLGSVESGPGTRLLLEAGRNEEARSRERLLAELAHGPTGASAWLEDPDPEVRSGAARTLAQVFTHEG